MRRWLGLMAFLSLNFSAALWAGEEPVAKPLLVLDTGGHLAQITQVLFTPSNSEIITVSLDKTVRIWKVATGQLVRTIRIPIGPGAVGELHAAALSRDGKILAVGGRWPVDGKKKTTHVIFLIDPVKGQIIRPLFHPGGTVRTLAIGGHSLAAGTDTAKIRVWDLDTGKILQTLDGHPGGTDAVAFSPDAQQLVSVGKDKVGRIWSLAEGKATAELKLDKTAVWRCAAWSPDGQAIATGLSDGRGPYSQNFALWLPGGKLIRRVAHLDARLMYVGSVAFTPDSKNVVEAAEDGYRAFVARFDTASGKKIAVYADDNHHHTETPHAPAAVSPNGKLVAVAGDRHHRTYIYTIGGKFLRAIGGKSRQITDLAWVRSKNRPNEILWRTDLMPQDRVMPRDVKPVKYFQQGFRWSDLQPAAVTPDPVRMWTWFGKDLRLDLRGPEAHVERNGKRVFTLRPPGLDEDWFHCATLVGEDKAALAKPSGFFLFSTHTGKLLHRLRGPNGEVRAVAPSPNGKFLLAGGDDQVLRIWDTEKSLPLLSLFMLGKEWIAWTPEGYYAATPGGERLVGWQVNQGLRQVANFYPADRFRKQLFRPDIIRLVLEKGSVTEAITTANAIRTKESGREMREVQLVDLLPPRAVLTVLDDSKKPLLKLRVQAEASAKDQPITALRLVLDGRVVPGKETLAEFPGGKARAEVEWAFELPAGEHQLAVMVRSPDSTGFSAPIKLKEVEPKQLPSLHLLAIGINQYQDGSLDLKYAEPDARALPAAFSKYCQGSFQEITTRTLLSQQATRPRILQELAQLRQRTKQQDLVVIFFACHGVKQKNTYYLLTHETDVNDLNRTALAGDDLRKALAEFKGQVLLMLDACHSAGFGAGKKLAKLGLKPATDDVTRDLTDDDVGVAVMCAAMAHEKAEGVSGHGLFTKAVLQALEKGPGVPFNPFNQRVYVHHLHTYVFDQVSHNSEERQHPFLSLPWIVESFVIR